MFRIPLPRPSGEILSEGLDNIFKNLMARRLKEQELEQNRPLIEAQTQKAQADAVRSNLIANYMQQAYAPESEKNNMQYGQTDNASPNQQNETSKSQKAKEILQRFGLIKETPAEQEAREKRTAYQRELGASDVKRLEKWGDSIDASNAIKPVLEHNQEILANPKIQELFSHPEYMNYDIAYNKRFNKDPETVDLLTTLGTNSKSIYQKVVSEFKGAAREFEFNLLNKSAPNEDRDTLQQMISKNNTILAIRDLITKRLTLAENIVRSSGGTISPSAASEIADKQINGKQIRKEIKQRFESEQKRLAKEKEEYDKTHKKELPKNEQSYATVIDPQGKRHEVYSSQIDAFLSDPQYKGWKKA